MEGSASLMPFNMNAGKEVARAIYCNNFIFHMFIILSQVKNGVLDMQPCTLSDPRHLN